MIEFYVSNEFKYLMSLNQHVLEKSMNLSFIPFPSYAFLFPPPTKPITIQTNSTIKWLWAIKDKGKVKLNILLIRKAKQNNKRFSSVIV